MRRYKFRAWNNELKTMADNNNLQGTLGSMILATRSDGNEFTFMQYTGLKDSNGIEIYEGDILTSEQYPYQDEGEYNYHLVIEYDGNESAAYFGVLKCVGEGKRGISDGISEILENTFIYEVIGNIYENPELL